jgi:4-hydroxy-tetrahydrodipicolinate reductase
MNALKIFLNGSKGRLNQTLANYAKENGLTVCTGGFCPRENPEPGLTEADVAIDFSFHAATLPLVKLAAQLKKPIVIATTGHSDEERAEILNYTKDIPIIWSGNYAIGVNVFFYAVRKAAERLGPLFDIEVIESHHAKKKDSPGGTAMRLVDILTKAYDWAPEETHVTHGRHGIIGARPPQQIGMHAIRAGDIVGEHTVLFAGPGERLEITQRSHDRNTFAQGAIMAAKWLLNQPNGLYRMEDVLNLND